MFFDDICGFLVIFIVFWIFMVFIIVWFMLKIIRVSMFWCCFLFFVWIKWFVIWIFVEVVVKCFMFLLFVFIIFYCIFRLVLLYGIFVWWLFIGLLLFVKEWFLCKWRGCYCFGFSKLVCVLCYVLDWSRNFFF